MGQSLYRHPLLTTPMEMCKSPTLGEGITTPSSVCTQRCWGLAQLSLSSSPPDCAPPPVGSTPVGYSSSSTHLLGAGAISKVAILCSHLHLLPQHLAPPSCPLLQLPPSWALWSLLSPKPYSTHVKSGSASLGCSNKQLNSKQQDTYDRSVLWEIQI